MASKSLVAAIAVGLAGLVWFSFGQGRSYPFVNFDDPEYVYEVPEISQGLTLRGIGWAFAHVPSPNWYPLTNISHMAEAQCFGMNPHAFHLTNIFLHAATAILLFLVLRAMTSELWPSAVVVALFAIHPLRAESVMWITERKDVLSGLFFVLTLGAYARYARKPSVVRYLLVSILFACGLMSKPMVVTLPFVLLLLDYWPLNRSQRSRISSQKLLLEKFPLFGMSAISAMITSAGGSRFRASAEHLPFIIRASNAVISYVDYIWQMIWPAKLAVSYPFPLNESPVWHLTLAGLLLIALTSAVFVVRRRHPYLFVGWLWYVIMMLPVIGLVQVNLQAHADRYTYLSHIGLCLAIVWGVRDISFGWIYRKQILIGAAAVVIGLLGWTARTQAATWKDSETLWRHALAVTENNYFAHASLADLLLRNGRTDAAMDHCREALRFHPNDADAENNLGLALLQTGSVGEAAMHLNRCLEINPDHMNGQANLAWILATSRDSSSRDGARAVELAERLAQRSGHANPVVLRTLAAAYAEAGRFNDAIDTARKALVIANINGNAGLATDLEANIENYRGNRPLRSGQ